MPGMSQPTPYTRATAFAEDEASNVGGRSTVRTARVDAEFDAVAQTLSETLTNLELIQRDDGKLRDSTVELHALSSAVLALLASYGATPRGAWVTATSYAYKDLIAQTGNTYICVTAHTSGTFATDLAAGRWMLFSLGSSIGAGAVSFSPTGTISATDVQAAINESDTENRALSAAAQATASAALPTASAASTSSDSLGAALIGWLFSRNYAANTIGWAVQRTGVTPTMCGAVGDGTTDDTIALQAWASSAFPKVGEPKTFKVSGQITFSANTCRVQGRGMVIDASAGGTFSDSSVVYCAGALSSVPDLSVSPSAGAVALTFGSAHGLVNNDVFIIYNPTDSSFNAARTYYRAGEYCRVNRAPTTSTVQLWSPLYAGYTAANVDIYKMAANQVSISDLTVIAPSSGSIRPLRLRLASRVRIGDVRCYGSDYVGIELDRCYDVEIRGSDLYEQPATYADEYGLSIGNCQDVRVIGGSYHAGRHCISIGGDDFTGVVPNRNIRVIGATLKNDQASLAPAADVHGNCQDVEYQNCTIYGGGSFGGLDNAYLNCRFYEAPSGLSALVIGGSECMGGVYRVEGCHLKSSPAFSVGLVRVASVAPAAAADAHLIVKNCTVEMGSCDTFARFDMGTSSFKANAHISGITFVSAPSLANICRMVGTGSAGDGDYVVVDDIANAKTGAVLYAAVSGYGSTVKKRLMRQTGSVDVTPVSAASLASATATFRLSYGSAIPHVTYALDETAVNSKRLTSSYRLKSGTGVTFDVATADAANFGATSPVVTVDYSAEISEI